MLWSIRIRDEARNFTRECTRVGLAVSVSSSVPIQHAKEAISDLCCQECFCALGATPYGQKESAAEVLGLGSRLGSEFIEQPVRNSMDSAHHLEGDCVD